MIDPKPSTFEPDSPRIENGRMVVDVPQSKERGPLYDTAFAMGFAGAVLGCAAWALGRRVYRTARLRAWERRQKDKGESGGPYRAGYVHMREIRGDGSIRFVETSVADLVPPIGPSGVSDNRPPPIAIPPDPVPVEE